MADFPSDPGGHFASDAHRRVMASVPIPGSPSFSTEEVIEKVTVKDDYLDLPLEDVVDILRNLESDGHITKEEGGWQHTKDGHALLTGPPKGDPDAEPGPAEIE